MALMAEDAEVLHEELDTVWMAAVDPDACLCDLHEADPEAILASVDTARLTLGRTAPSAGAFIDARERQRLVRLAACLRPERS